MRILLVEDELRMAQALCELLRQEKDEVDHFADGLEGLEAIETGIYDVVILDVMLPHMNGFEIVKRGPTKRDPYTGTHVDGKKAKWMIKLWDWTAARMII